ncbi:unnamed protein product [Trichobilharzia regenti]|nr:unnamed protein product [Trichobilharzia regenti]
MTTEINQATEESNEISYSKNPTSSPSSSSAPSAACNEFKENVVPLVRLIKRLFKYFMVSFSIIMRTASDENNNILRSVAVLRLSA